MSVATAYRYTCQFCETIREVARRSIKTTSNLSLVFQTANKAASAAQNGEHEKAKLLIMGNDSK